ncbi:uncharacterized protein LOC130430076 isoform X2 [Triplophysa dalaica]|uniref:uncharacterized protein LOC130430076 isoform X2 n=1 Tax=Triplophysa dalaica TaxID=1582913 RepID=UPI0024DF6608|nr:uncharacterized protein LOC130430076 isoform X2 [Triplophysa dalaica]
MCVFGVDPDEVKSMSVLEGDSVTLHTDLTDIQRDDQILWLFGPQESRIAEIYKQKPKTETGRHGDRLKLNKETGSLTITKTKITDSGLYQLQIINSSGTLYKIFNVSVYGVFGVDPDEVKSMSVMEGDSVTLHTHLTRIQRDDQILWLFGPQESGIAEIYKQKPKTETGRHGDRLKLNMETGSLIITNFTITDSGLYQLQIINSSGTFFKIFNVTVNDATASNRSHVCAIIVAVVVGVLMVFIMIVVAVKHCWTTRQSRQRSHEERGYASIT